MAVVQHRWMQAALKMEEEEEEGILLWTTYRRSICGNYGHKQKYPLLMQHWKIQ